MLQVVLLILPVGLSWVFLLLNIFIIYFIFNIQQTQLIFIFHLKTKQYYFLYIYIYRIKIKIFPINCIIYIIYIVHQCIKLPHTICINVYWKLYQHLICQEVKVHSLSARYTRHLYTTYYYTNIYITLIQHMYKHNNDLDLVEIKASLYAFYYNAMKTYL